MADRLSPPSSKIGQFDFLGVQGVVAGHDEASASVTDVEADGAALVLAQGSAAFPDGFDIRCADEQAVGDEAKHADFRLTSGLGAAGIGDLMKFV